MTRPRKKVAVDPAKWPLYPLWGGEKPAEDDCPRCGQNLVFNQMETDVVGLEWMDMGHHFYDTPARRDLIIARCDFSSSGFFKFRSRRSLNG